MINAPYELQQEDNNPLDMIEELAETKGWKCVRSDDDYMTLVLKGQKTNFEAAIEWQEEFSAILFACSMPLTISDMQYEVAAHTIEQINQNLWLGHFDLSNQGKHPTFRHTLLLRLIPTGLAVDIINDLIEVAVAECNRFYTTFQLVQAGDVKLRDNLHAVIFETIGEA